MYPFNYINIAWDGNSISELRGVSHRESASPFFRRAPRHRVAKSTQSQGCKKAKSAKSQSWIWNQGYVMKLILCLPCMFNSQVNWVVWPTQWLRRWADVRQRRSCRNCASKLFWINNVLLPTTIWHNPPPFLVPKFWCTRFQWVFATLVAVIQETSPSAQLATAGSINATFLWVLTNNIKQLFKKTNFKRISKGFMNVKRRG